MKKLVFLIASILVAVSFVLANLIVDILSKNIEPPMESIYPSQIDVAQTIAWICSQRHIRASVINMPGPNPGSVN